MLPRCAPGSKRWAGKISEVSAAPHRPAGHFSPYSDGEKEAGRNRDAFLATLAVGETVDNSIPRPVYGERMAAAR